MYNKEDYRSNKESIIKHYEKRGLQDMSAYSAMTGIPIIVVYELLEEEYPDMSKEFQARIKTIKDFFGIK